jgi:hypothetical protein
MTARHTTRVIEPARIWPIRRLNKPNGSTFSDPIISANAVARQRKASA